MLTKRWTNDVKSAARCKLCNRWRQNDTKSAARCRLLNRWPRKPEGEVLLSLALNSFLPKEKFKMKAFHLALSTQGWLYDETRPQERLLCSPDTPASGSNIFFSSSRGQLSSVAFHSAFPWPGGAGGRTPYNGLYGEAPPERGTFFRLQV